MKIAKKCSFMAVILNWQKNVTIIFVFVDANTKNSLSRIIQMRINGLNSIK